MSDLEQAIADPHFAGRGVFAHEIITARGSTIPPLPVPIDPGFRAPPHALPAVRPGANNGVI